MKKYFAIFLYLLSVVTYANGDLYKVILLKGQVEMEREGQKRKLFKGDFLIPNDKLITGPKSLVILGFGDNQSSKMKVGPKSKVVMKGTSFSNEERKDVTRFFLDVGNVLVDFLNKDKTKKTMQVDTKTAAMGVRGTEFFIHASSDERNLVAVKSGVVLAGHNKKRLNFPLISEEGVVFTKNGSSGKIKNPAWYKHINWSLDEYEKDLNKLQHSQEIDKQVTSKMTMTFLKLNSSKVEKLDLNGDPKVWKSECLDSKIAKSCTKLAFYILKTTNIDNSRDLLRNLFAKGCEYKDNQACIWSGRLEVEAGNKEKGMSYLNGLCQKTLTYACYSLWEIHKKNGEFEKAEEYEKKLLALMNGLESIDGALAEFKQGCEANDPDACSNVGILLEKLKKEKESREFYEKSCNLGGGAGCSNLGYFKQEDGALNEAKKLYQKACFLKEEYGCYNLACIYSKKKKTDLSLQYLKMALHGGFDDFEHIKGDGDLEHVRKDSKFKSIIDEYKKKK